jgi:hypothetical protein
VEVSTLLFGHFSWPVTGTAGVAKYLEQHLAGTRLTHKPLTADPRTVPGKPAIRRASLPVARVSVA